MRDTIDMASEAQLVCSINNPTTPWMEDHDLTPYLKAFEALVRADAIADERDKWMERMAILIRGEREACAKVCEALHYEVDAYGAQCAAAIRARGNT